MSDPQVMILSWLGELARMVSGGRPIPDLREKLTAYADHLAEDFPPGAFTRASLRAIAESCGANFPAYGEIAVPLRAWWAEHAPKPAAPALAPPAGAEGLSASGQSWLRFCLSRADEGRDPGALISLLRHQEERAAALALIRLDPRFARADAARGFDWPELERCKRGTAAPP